MFKKGDNVVLILKPNGNLEMKKEKTNFWDEVSKMSAKEKRLQIEDLGYDPLEQRSKGRERIEDEQLEKVLGIFFDEFR